MIQVICVLICAGTLPVQHSEQSPQFFSSQISVFAYKYSTTDCPSSQSLRIEQETPYLWRALLSVLLLQEYWLQYGHCRSLFPQRTQGCCLAVGTWSTSTSHGHNDPVLLWCNWIFPNPQHQSQPAWQTKWATWLLGLRRIFSSLRRVDPWAHLLHFAVPGCGRSKQPGSVSECYASWCVACTSWLTTQLEESGNWRKRTATRRPNSWPTFALTRSFSHASHWSGNDSLSPITVDMVTGSSFSSIAPFLKLFSPQTCTNRIYLYVLMYVCMYIPFGSE